MKRLGGLLLVPRPRIGSIMAVASTCSNVHIEYSRFPGRGLLFLERFFDGVVQRVPKLLRVEVVAVAQDHCGPVRDQIAVVSRAEAAPLTFVAVAVHATPRARVEIPTEAVLVNFAVARLGRRECKFHGFGLEQLPAP